MTKRTDRSQLLDPLAREALSWVVRLKSGAATLADAEQLMDWRARSPAHEHAFRDAVKRWRNIGAALSDGPPDPPLSPRRKN